VIERIMTGLRLIEGLDSPELLSRAESASPGSAARLHAAAQGLVRDRLLAATSRWTLTNAGFLVANAVIVRFMEAMDPPDAPRRPPSPRS
jgi:coproporphyrinogen III oxidase-like Fe-S oxidoreductase